VVRRLKREHQDPWDSGHPTQTRSEKRAMAKRKAATSSALVPISEGSLPDFGSKYGEQMALQRTSTPLTAGMPRIRSGQGMFLMPGAQHGVETFDAVALCALRVNRYHEGKYDPKNPTPPVCVAIARLGQHENAMAPDPGWPQVQSDSCLTCKRNVRGGQKECRNGIDVALVSADGGEIDWAKTAIWSHSISSTGIQPFGKMLGFLGEKKAPLFAAVLRFSSRQLDGKSYYTTVATPVAWLPSPAVDALGERVKEAESALLANAEPFVAAEAGEAETAGAKPPMRKAAAKPKGRSLR
jgi:hypothetical protein